MTRGDNDSHASRAENLLDPIFTSEDVSRRNSLAHLLSFGGPRPDALRRSMLISRDVSLFA